MKFFRTFLAIIVISCIACLTGCSSDDDLNPIIGSWSKSIDTGTPDWGNCIITTDLIISKNGTFDKSKYYDCEIGEDWESVDSGTWEVANGLLNVNLTDDEISYYYFITSTGQLSLTDGDYIFERQDSGTGIVGYWLREYGNGHSRLNFYANGQRLYNQICDEENCLGIMETYVTSGDRMTIEIGTEYEYVQYFKLFGNYLAIDDEENLFTRQ